MARRQFTGFVVDSNGDTVSSGQVEVRDAGGSLVTLYEASTGATEAYSGANPFSAGDGTPDKVGYFTFWVDTPVDLSITTGSGATSNTFQVYFSNPDFAAGSASAPSVSPTGDEDTGLFFPAADEVAVAIGGTERSRLTATGYGLGTTSPEQRLDVRGNIQIRSNGPVLQIRDDNAATNEKRWNITGADGPLRIQGLTDAGSGSGDYLEIERSGNNMTGVRLLDNTVSKVFIGNDGDGEFAGRVMTPIDAEYHGCLPGAGDVSTEFGDWLDYLITNNAVGRIGSGDFTLGSLTTKTLASAKRMGIRGQGAPNTRFIIPDTNTTGFLDIDATISRANQFVFRDFSVIAQGNTGKGLHVRQYGGGSQHQRTIVCENVSIRGENTTSDHFDSPFNFTGAWRPYIRNCIYDGPWVGVTDANSSARFFTGTAFDLQDAYSPFVTDCRAWGCSTGICSDVFIGTITGITDNGDGTVQVTTSATHPFSTGASVTITGTTNYNGNFTITRVSDTAFDITATFVSSQTGTCANAEGPEGGWFLNNIVNGCKTGIDWSRFNSTREPLAYFIGNHINYRDRGIQVDGGKLIIIRDNIIYNEDSDDTFTGTPADIDLANADTFIVTGNICHFGGHSDRRGVQVVGASGAQGTDGYIDKNIFSASTMDSNIFLSGNTSNITGSNLHTNTPTTANVTDNGSGNTVT